MNNREVRIAIVQAGIKYYELAARIGISPYTLSVWLRRELKGERLHRVQDAIKQLTDGDKHG